MSPITQQKFRYIIKLSCNVCWYKVHWPWPSNAMYFRDYSLLGPNVPAAVHPKDW